MTGSRFLHSTRSTVPKNMLTSFVFYVSTITSVSRLIRNRFCLQSAPVILTMFQILLPKAVAALPGGFPVNAVRNWCRVSAKYWENV